MLGKKRLLKLMMTLIICITLITVPALAAGSDPVFSVKTDKSSYADGESITAVFSVDNVTGNAIKNIKLSGAIPDGYTAKSGTDASGNWNAEISSVAAGEKGSVTVEFVKNSAAPQSTDITQTDITKKENTTAIKTGDSHRTLIAFVALVLSFAGIFVLAKTNKGRKILSIILVGALAISTLVIGNNRAYALENGMVAGTPEYAVDESDRAIAGMASKNGTIETKTTELKASFTVADKPVEIKATVSYESNAGSQDLSYDGYTLMWRDEFSGSSLNRDDWNVELHAPGWVNEELQAYVDSEENIYVKDGNLVIKPVKNGNSYTSGRVNTMDKHDYKYGLFEARVKVPSGKGYLPAFWLMPTDENLYGQWPRCGEIDAMEVMGQDTKKVYGTIHYGNPHAESQGTKTLTEGDFSEEYHVFDVEWEPGVIRWYVDGMLYHEENDWYSTTKGQGTVSYPAPFDQKFYVILNLAIGGKWVGYPDSTTTYENQEYDIDYVRVYQKASYDENVEKPEKEIVMRDPDANGNYVINGDFSTNEALNDTKDWVFLTAEGGKATATIENGVLRIDSTAAGTEDHSVQLVQAGIPAKKGATYRLSFDAWADAERTMKVNMDAIDRGWERYLPDKKVELSRERKSFEFEYSMSDDNDPNSRLEFNLGNTASTATVYIDNVKIVKVAQADADDDKGMLSDGNFVYNGKFQEGKNRMAYWEIENYAGATVSVTNDDEHSRRLKIVAPEGTSEDFPVIISQNGIAVIGGMKYAYSFDAEGENDSMIIANFIGNEVVATLTGEDKTFTGAFVADEVSEDNTVSFTIVRPGTYYLDNIILTEDKLIKNGSFNFGLAGYDPFIDSSAEAKYAVDSLDEGKAFDMTINDTGDADWKIQLKQSNVRLVEGKWYRLSLDMKSSIDRKVVVALQRDGAVHKTEDGAEDWTPYAQKTFDLGTDYQSYEIEFQMNPATAPKSDNGAIFNVSMGAVGGEQIKEQHRVYIDNIVLEEIDEPENVIEPKPYNEELISNGSFANGSEGWTMYVANPATGTIGVDNGKVVAALTSAGSNEWDARLVQGFDLQIEQNQKYILSFKAKSTVARKIKLDLMTEGYVWYGGGTPDIGPDEQTVNIQFTAPGDKETSDKVGLFVSMGKVGDQTAASTITLDDFSLVKVEEFPADNPDGDNMITNADFSNGLTGWEGPVMDAGAAATASVEDGKVIVNITNPGTAGYHIQLKQTGIALENGKTYKVTFKAKCNVERKMLAGVQHATNYTWYGGGAYDLTDEFQEFSYQLIMPADANCSNAAVYFTMGSPLGVGWPEVLYDQPTESIITISDIEMVEVTN